MSDYVHRVEDGATSREVKRLYQFFQQFKEISDEIIVMFSRLRTTQTTNHVTEVHAGLIANSSIDTLNRIQEVIETLIQNGVSWELEKNKKFLLNALESNAQVFKELRRGKLLPPDILDAREEEKEKIEEQIKLLLAN
jgi:hypothetical protein